MGSAYNFGFRPCNRVQRHSAIFCPRLILKSKKIKTSMIEAPRLAAAVQEIAADLIDRRIMRDVAVSRGVARLLAVMKGVEAIDRGPGRPQVDDGLSLQRIRAAIDAGASRAAAVASESRRLSVWGGKSSVHAKRLRKKLRIMPEIAG